MESIRLKARAKINLGLDVIGRRENGYHDVRMVMQTVGLYDRIIMTRIPEEEIRIKTNIGFLPVNENNLVYKAIMLMKNKYKLDGGIEVDLNKFIPVAAGMAGGSSDAACALFGMNRLFELNVPMKELMKLGVEIGADVPYCLMRGTALAEGRGEILTKIAPCPKAWIVLAKPPVGLSTPAVYKAIDSLNIEYHPDTDGIIKAIKNNDIYEISSKLSNVLEEASIPMCPMIGQIKEKLLLSGAIGSLMSGSGPTVYGIFDDVKKAENAVNVIKDEFKIRDVILTKIFNA